MVAAQMAGVVVGGVAIVLCNRSGLSIVFMRHTVMAMLGTNGSRVVLFIG